MKERIKPTLPIIVEGRYDKAMLSGFVDAVILTTGGFSIFNNKEKQELIRRISADGIIVLTDSDGGGKQIRKFLAGIVPEGKIHNLYIPKIIGKEKRKVHPSKAGTLGVEGMEREVVERLLLPFVSSDESSDVKNWENGEIPAKVQKKITKVDFFEDKLAGAENSSARRRLLCELCNLPSDMTANALLEAMNLLYGYEGYKDMIAKIDG